jgi:hypothetical protein
MAELAAWKAEGVLMPIRLLNDLWVSIFHAKYDTSRSIKSRNSARKAWIEQAKLLHRKSEVLTRKAVEVNAAQLQTFVPKAKINTNAEFLSCSTKLNARTGMDLEHDQPYLSNIHEALSSHNTFKRRYKAMDKGLDAVNALPFQDALLGMDVNMIMEQYQLTYLDHTNGTSMREALEFLAVASPFLIAEICESTAYDTEAAVAPIEKRHGLTLTGPRNVLRCMWLNRHFLRKGMKYTLTKKGNASDGYKLELKLGVSPLSFDMLSSRRGDLSWETFVRLSVPAVIGSLNVWLGKSKEQLTDILNSVLGSVGHGIGQMPRLIPRSGARDVAQRTADKAKEGVEHWQQKVVIAPGNTQADKRDQAADTLKMPQKVQFSTTRSTLPEPRAPRSRPRY